MTRNTQEFDDSILQAMKHLEDDRTDILLQGVGHSDGQIRVQIGYNGNSDIPEEGLVRLLTAMTVAIEPNFEESVEKLLDEVREQAVSMQAHQ